MRVLLFGSEYPPSPTGTAAYASGLARGLADAGAEVRVLTQGPAGTAPAGPAPMVPADPVPVSRIAPTGPVPWRYLRCARALRRELATFRPDCLWTTNGMATRVVGCLPELPRLEARVIACARGSDIRTRLPGRSPWRRLESVPQRRCYTAAVGVAAVSDELRRVAIAKGVAADKLFINYPAFDFATLDSATSTDVTAAAREPGLVLTVARLTAQKAVDALVRAVGLLPTARLAIVGDGPRRSSLERLVAELELGARVHFVGALPWQSATLHDWYRRAAVFALVSAGEGLGNVFIEAGAFGLPCVGGDDGGTPEVVRHGDTGWLVPPGQIEPLAERLEQLLQRPVEAAEMGRRAHDFVRERFSIDALGRSSFRILSCLLETGRLPRPTAA